MKIYSIRFLYLAMIAIGFLVSCSKSNSDFYPIGGLLPTKYIHILDSSFSPLTLTAAIGSSVTFVNSSTISHTIVSDDTTTFRTQGMAPGTSFYMRIDSAGTYNYHCSEHPNARGTIILTP